MARHHKRFKRSRKDGLPSLALPPYAVARAPLSIEKDTLAFLTGLHPKRQGSPVIVPTVLAAGLLILAMVEFRLQRRSLRLAAASLALVVLWFSEPNYTAAARRALLMAHAERITVIRGVPLPEYSSGVRTMERAVSDDSAAGAPARLMGVAILFWLACSPALRKKAGEQPVS